MGAAGGRAAISLTLAWQESHADCTGRCRTSRDQPAYPVLTGAACRGATDRSRKGRTSVSALSSAPIRLMSSRASTSPTMTAQYRFDASAFGGGAGRIAASYKHHDARTFAQRLTEGIPVDAVQASARRQPRRRTTDGTWHARVSFWRCVTAGDACIEFVSRTTAAIRPSRRSKGPRAACVLAMVCNWGSAGASPIGPGFDDSAHELPEVAPASVTTENRSRQPTAALAASEAQTLSERSRCAVSIAASA